jgi:glycosyltransferase involved in cell wall biosynthesis
MLEVNSPKVSVCVPTFNGADYLRQAIDSVLEQDYEDFEIVIVDNCSTDQTATVIDGLLLKAGGRIRFYKNDRNIGLAGNLNKCLEYARGIYIKFLCVDDLLLPGCLEQMAAGLDTYPAVTVICSGRRAIDEADKPLGLRRYASRSLIVRGRKAITRCLFGGNFIGEPTAVMFRKRDLTSCFREDLPQLMDMEMWFRLLEQGDLLNIEKPLCSIRHHDAQMTHVNFKSGKLVLDRVKIFEDYSHKAYLEATPLLVIQHKLLMTYRVWMSRRFISNENRKMVLDRYAISCAYPLMPLIWFAVTLKKKIERG